MPSHHINLGILLPTRGILLRGTPVTNSNLILDMAHQAEAAGLHSVWVGDSLTAKPRLEPLLTLAAIASSTKKLRLGTAVLLAALRHPVLLAQMANTLDVLSSGRLILAVGAGGSFTQQQKEEWQESVHMAQPCPSEVPSPQLQPDRARTETAKKAVGNTSGVF